MLTKDDIKDWLKKTGKTRQELAEQVGVGLSCVNNWLSNSKTNLIPPLKLQLIERLMAESEQPPAPQPPTPKEITAIAVLMSKEQRAYLTAAARKLGLTLEEFILLAAMERAERAIGAISQTNSSAC